MGSPRLREDPETHRTARFVAAHGRRNPQDIGRTIRPCCRCRRLVELAGREIPCSRTVEEKWLAARDLCWRVQPLGMSVEVRETPESIAPAVLGTLMRAHL